MRDYMRKDYAKVVYDTYLESTYLKANILTEKEYQRAAKGYDANYSRFLPHNKNAMILDLGCGTGTFLWYLKKKGYTNFWGIDISRQQVYYCKNHITKNVEIAEASEFLLGKTEVYDLIVMNDVLEHIQKQKILRLLQLAHNSLNEEGTVVIRVPNMANPFSLGSRYTDITHEVGFTEASLRQVLKIAGFERVGFYPTGGTKSIKGFIGKMGKGASFMLIKIMYRAQGYGVPRILSCNILAVARK